MSTLRVALVGCGDHGRHGHLEAYQKLIQAGEDLDVVAVCDRDEGRAKSAAETLPSGRWYCDYEEMLADQRPDAVSIATPPAFHRAHVMAALRSGAHVLCEKPLAMNLAEAREMVTAAEECGRILTMGLEHRYVPASDYLRSIVMRGDLGQVYHTRLWCGHVWKLPPSPHFLQRSLAGGGVIAATAVHWLDLALWILGNPNVVTVSASTFAKAPRLRVPPPPFSNAPEGARILTADNVEDFAGGSLFSRRCSRLPARGSHWPADVHHRSPNASDASDGRCTLRVGPSPV
jgi:predicted dehydrogenase